MLYVTQPQMTYYGGRQHGNCRGRGSHTPVLTRGISKQNPGSWIIWPLSFEGKYPRFGRIMFMRTNHFWRTRRRKLVITTYCLRWRTRGRKLVITTYCLRCLTSSVVTTDRFVVFHASMFTHWRHHSRWWPSGHEYRLAAVGKGEEVHLLNVWTFSWLFPTSCRVRFGGFMMKAG